MTQDYLGQIINRTTKTGIALADDLDAFDLSIKSGFSGPTRPNGIMPGGVWVKFASGAYQAMIYDGSVDVPVGQPFIQVSSNDTTPASLESKLIADSNYFSLETANEGGNEQRRIKAKIAIESEAKAGISSAGLMTPLRTKQAMDSALSGWGFVGTASVLSSYSSVTVTHNLGAAPSKISMDLICTVANNGYVVGDLIVDVSPTITTGAQRGILWFIPSGNTSDIKIVIGGALRIISATGYEVALDYTSWKFIIKASL